MKKIVVISDTHGNKQALAKLSDIMFESDYVFHLGDCYDDFTDYAYALKEKAFQVHGNCDYGGNREIVTEAEEHKILATHGHEYGVKQTRDKLYRRAKELGCDLVFYGHTHVAEIETVNGITFINPGCMTLYSTVKSFAYVVLNGEKVTAVINDKLLN